MQRRHSRQRRDAAGCRRWNDFPLAPASEETPEPAAAFSFTLLQPPDSTVLRAVASLMSALAHTTASERRGDVATRFLPPLR
jgi:hypothetical protein